MPIEKLSMTKLQLMLLLHTTMVRQQMELKK